MDNWEKREYFTLAATLFSLIVLPAVIGAVVAGTWIPIMVLGIVAVAVTSMMGFMSFVSWLGRKIFPD